MSNPRWPSLIVLCTGFLLIVVDMTIVNVALPSIQRDLGFTQGGLAWVINSYLIAFGGLLLLAGRIGDLLGRKRTFLAGLAMFVAASVLCGLSINQPMLIAARFVQGVGGAVSSSVILAMIVTLFPEPGDQARAFGVFSFVASAGAAVGLLAGGLITQAVSWHWIFFVNVPIGLATAVAAGRLLRPDRGLGLGRGADVIGAVTVTAALMLGVYAIVDTSPRFGAGSIALLIAFVVRQARVRNPILPLRLFASRGLAVSNVVQALMSSAFFGFFFLGSLDLERVLGYSPMGIGLAFLPVAVVMAIFSVRFSARLIGRFGPVPVLAAGQAVALIALAALALGPTQAVYPVHLLVPLALLGLGGGLSFPALTIIAMSGVPVEDAGLASGILNTTGQVGGALGLAVLATLAGWRSMSGASLSGGYHLAWLVAAGLAALSLGIVVTVLRRRAVPAIQSTEVACEAAA